MTQEDYQDNNWHQNVIMSFAKPTFAAHCLVSDVQKKSSNFDAVESISLPHGKNQSDYFILLNWLAGSSLEPEVWSYRCVSLGVCCSCKIRRQNTTQNRRRRSLWHNFHLWCKQLSLKYKQKPKDISHSQPIYQDPQSNSRCLTNNQAKNTPWVIPIVILSKNVN